MLEVVGFQYDMDNSEYLESIVITHTDANIY